MGQRSPDTAIAVAVEDGINHGPHLGLAWPPTDAGRRQEGLQDSPLLACQITGVWLWVHTLSTLRPLLEQTKKQGTGPTLLATVPSNDRLPGHGSEIPKRAVPPSKRVPTKSRQLSFMMGRQDTLACKFAAIGLIPCLLVLVRGQVMPRLDVCHGTQTPEWPGNRNLETVEAGGLLRARSVTPWSGVRTLDVHHPPPEGPRAIGVTAVSSGPVGLGTPSRPRRQGPDTPGVRARISLSRLRARM